MKNKNSLLAKAPGFLALLSLCFSATAEELPERERANQIAQKYLLTDTHIDVPYRLHSGWVDVTGSAPDGQFDYPRAVKGGLNLPFMSIYTPAEMEEEGGSFELANQLIDSVEAMVARAPDKFMLVRSVADAEKTVPSEKIGLAMGLENGSPIDHKLENVRYFADRGIRYITLTHGLSNQIADSSYDENRRWGGLSPFGKEVISEMNRVGIMVDISHVSDDAFWQTLEVSKVPVIASHSSARVFTPGFERNMSDEMIIALAKNGGVIQINWGSSFLTASANEYSTAFWKLQEEWAQENGVAEDSAEAKKFASDYKENSPYPYATMAETVDHFDHVIKLVGIDHVGIGFDVCYYLYPTATQNHVEGFQNIGEANNLFLELEKLGYNKDDIEKIKYKNFFRVSKKS